MTSQHDLLTAARGGDDAAFASLVGPHEPKIRALAHRMLGHPEDADDVVQDALLQAFRKLDTFREEASFGTWLFSITTRLCLNHLRARKRWRWDAQRDLPADYGPTLHHAPESPAADPGFRFDVHEHIAFCFTCVGRSLPPVQQATLVLRDVFDYRNREAAKILGLSESVLRHNLSAARTEMQDRFDGLCALVNKEGVCHQCEGLRNSFAEARRGREIPTLRAPGDTAEDSLRKRLRVVKETEFTPGPSREIHEEMFRRVARIEQSRVAATS